MLTLTNVETHYGASQALFGVSLNIKPAGVTTLLGRNGMGKTTTISSIMNIKPKTNGSIVFNKEDITNLPSFKIAKLGIGLVPEGRQIFPNLTAHENLIATANISEKKNLNNNCECCEFSIRENTANVNSKENTWVGKCANAKGPN